MLVIVGFICQIYCLCEIDSKRVGHKSEMKVFKWLAVNLSDYKIMKIQNILELYSRATYNKRIQRDK